MKVLKNKGFTLAEMLIVMAVVVVLAAATIPAIQGQTEAAKQSNDLAALRDVYVQAYTEIAMERAGGGTGTSASSPVSVTFQQTSGSFDKMTSSKIANYNVTSISGATGTKNVTFTFGNSSDMNITAITCS